MSAVQMMLASRTVSVAGLVCLLGFGSFLIWASIAPLAEGVVAHGRVSGENDHQVVQHLEGGIVHRIHVGEGDQVVADQPLVELAGVQVSAGRDQVIQGLANGLASVERLRALSEGRQAMDFSNLAALDIPAQTLTEIQARQENLFEQQRETFNASITVLESRKDSLLLRAETLSEQIANTRRARNLLREEISRNRELVEMRMMNARELSAMEVQEAQMASDLSRLQSDQLTTRSEAGELDAQISQTQAQFFETLSDELVVAQGEVLSAQEQLSAAQDMVNRTIVYAPQAGTVLNLNFSTVGGVVRPGEEILQLVPNSSDLVVVLQIRPLDRDAISEGLDVDVKLSGLNAWQFPVLAGTVEAISADLKTSERGDAQYYEARVLILPESVEELGRRPNAGMPVEAFVSSGHSRTFFAYLVEPLTTIIRRGVRE